MVFLCGAVSRGDDNREIVEERIEVRSLRRTKDEERPGKKEEKKEKEEEERKDFCRGKVAQELSFISGGKAIS